MTSEENYLECSAYSEELLLFCLSDKSGVSMDVGAGSGRLVRFMSCNSSETLAFECNPFHSQTIKKGIDGAWQKWGGSGSFENIILHEKAVSDHNGGTKLRAPKNSHGWGTIEQKNTLERKIHEGIDEFTVTTVKLDDAWTNHKGPNEKIELIKVDVEGHEASVLRGASQILEAHGPCFYIELYEGHRKGNAKEVMNFLASYGYRGLFISNSDLKPIQECDFEKHLNYPPSRCDINFLFVKNAEQQSRIEKCLALSQQIGRDQIAKIINGEIVIGTDPNT